jgi:hypothetical protein
MMRFLLRQGAAASSICAAAWLLVAPAHAAIEHVIVISVDGLRGDFLETLLAESPAEFPNFVRLRDSSALRMRRGAKPATR